YRCFDVLVQVRRIGVHRKRPPLRAIRRQEHNLAIAAIDVGREHRGDAAPRDGLAEDQMALGQIDADVFPLQREIAHAVALVTVEAVFANGARDVGGGSGVQAERQRKPESEYPHDSSILQPERPARSISAMSECPPMLSAKPGVSWTLVDTSV